MAAGPLSQQQLTQYGSDGYLLRKACFDQEEIDLLRRAAKRGQRTRPPLVWQR